jgi:hypothetical protein
MSETLTIGAVITALEAAPPDASVYFDFCRCVPTAVDSWRGVYSEAALGFALPGCHVSAAALLAELRSASDGRAFTGWKGGDFRYSLDTPLHVDNPGCYTSTALVGVENKEWCIVLHTKRGDE